ncbi:MAG: SARP family transcriptional regulator, partial [Anaerolineae bacterium]|nr:SARP family transcriptional regulator [Anaerolineae bacterium]
MAEIADLLSDPACRLLTLVGPGGIGKTRLAIEAATPMLDDFAHSVYFVALQPISETANIVSAIASAIDCQFYEAAEPEQQLLNFLREKQMLLLLDNFEHLLAGTSLVVSILETAPEVKVLVTSREVLRLQQEWVYDIRGMSFPEDVKTTPLETYSAVHLFVERARRAQGHFKLEDNWADVVRICQLIEGMPLGIELAAAWTRIMSCQQLAEELAVSLDILTSRQRGLEPRHASLRAVFAHSWKLLNEDEQLVLMKLSVFKGGFTAEAAAAIAGASLPLLAALVDKSLLRADEEGRYDLHEAVRQFAAELLAADTDAELETRERHCDYFAQLLHERVVAVQLISWTEVLPEMDNVRVAWTHAAQQRKLSALQQAMPALSGIYLLQAWFEEGERMFQFAEDGLRDLPPTNDTRFLLGAALLFKAHCQRDQLAKADQMKRNLEAGLALWQGMAPRREMILPHW